MIYVYVNHVNYTQFMNIQMGLGIRGRHSKRQFTLWKSSTNLREKGFGWETELIATLSHFESPSMNSSLLILTSPDASKSSITLSTASFVSKSISSKLIPTSSAVSSECEIYPSQSRSSFWNFLWPKWKINQIKYRRLQNDLKPWRV